jgi:hypothetical protein
VVSKTVLPMPENGISGRATPVLKRSGPLVEGSGGEKTSKELASSLLLFASICFEDSRDNPCSQLSTPLFELFTPRSIACCLAY